MSKVKYIKQQLEASAHLTVTLPFERLGVVSLPCGLARTTIGLTELVSLAKTTMLLSGAGETAQFAMLVLEIHDPVDAGIPVTTDIERLLAIVYI